jgi:hypothetical protein
MGSTALGAGQAAGRDLLNACRGPYPFGGGVYQFANPNYRQERLTYRG